MSREPPDRDQVAGHIESALRAEDDVVQGRMLDVPPADAATGVVALDDGISNICRDESKAFELQFALRLPASHWLDITD